MKKYIISVVIAVTVAVGFVICLKSDLNLELEINELKAYFRERAYLDYYPNPEEIGRIEIGGMISMSEYDEKIKGTSVYTGKEHIKQITDYLNGIVLVEAEEEELPNKSPDSSIAYIDNNGNKDKLFVIYGRAFIKDENTGKLYRAKNAHMDFVQGLENMDFN